MKSYDTISGLAYASVWYLLKDVDAFKIIKFHHLS